MCYNFDNLVVSSERKKNFLINVIEFSGIEVEGLEEASIDELVELANNIMNTIFTKQNINQIDISDAYPELQVRYGPQMTIEDFMNSSASCKQKEVVRKPMHGLRGLAHKDK